MADMGRILTTPCGELRLPLQSHGLAGSTLQHRAPGHVPGSFRRGGGLQQRQCQGGADQAGVPGQSRGLRAPDERPRPCH